MHHLCFEDSTGDTVYLTAHPKSSLAFHWPRPDLNPLLCLRLLESSRSSSGTMDGSRAAGGRARASLWSGGFEIEKVCKQ